MGETKPTVLVTGISGNLGLRLLPQLADFNVIGVDLNPPQTDLPLSFERMDLGQEESCRQLYLLMRQTNPVAVVHLAFVIDPVRTGVLNVDRMWQINVAGTARVMEAITEANRDVAVVEKFIFPSSVSAYGSDLPRLVTEEFPLGGHTLPYAIHKMESDRVVQQRAPSLRGPACRIIWLARFAARQMAAAIARNACEKKASASLACCRTEESIWRIAYSSSMSTIWRG